MIPNDAMENDKNDISPVDKLVNEEKNESSLGKMCWFTHFTH